MTTDRVSPGRLSIQGVGGPVQAWHWAAVENWMSAFLDGRVKPQFVNSPQVTTG